jgi:predicted nucleic acid-binding Zn finger protein
VLWQGNLLGDSTPQRSYFVVVYDDGSGRCSCPDYYFRAVIKDVLDYTCKHIRRVRAQLAE